MPRLLLAAVLCLAACSAGGEPVMSSGIVGTTAAPDDDLAARAEAAGLAPDQARRLVDLGVPVAVPVLPAGWTLTGFDAGVYEEGPMRYPAYMLTYRHTAGACFVLDAASEGLGDAFVIAPPHEAYVEVTGLAAYDAVPLGWGDEGEDEDWGGRLGTEWFGADGLFVMLRGGDGDACPPPTPEAAKALLGDLRYLDPADDVLALGPMQWVEVYDPARGDYDRGPTPEHTAAQAFAMTEGEGRFVTLTETLRRRDGHAVVLVTNANVPDDSIQGERVRVVLQADGDGWIVTQAGRQVRCREGRGHADWGADACL